MSATAKYIVARRDALATRRQFWEGLWQEILDYCLPYRGEVVSGPHVPGQRPMRTLFDDAGMQSAELLAAALHAILTNPFSLWFGYQVPYTDIRENVDVLGWLEEIENITFQEVSDSNFDPQAHEGYLDLTTIAGFTMYCGEGEKLGQSLSFDTLPAKEVYWDVDYEGQVDTVYRVFTLTARQAMQKFKAFKNKLSKNLRAAARNPENTDEFEFIHAVYPRTDHAPGKVDRLNMPWASVYVEVDGQSPNEKSTLIYESGFQEFPYMCPRWTLGSGEIYGRSPAMRTLPMIRMANQIARTMLRAGEKKAEPPLQVPDDGFLKPKVSTSPNAINTYRAGTTDRIEQLPVGDPAFTESMLEYYHKRIQDGFHLNQVQLISQAYMTAEEVIQRTAERDRLLGPMLGRQRWEFLRPLMARVFGLLWRAGKYPAPPPALNGRPVVVEYISPLARAQRIHQAEGVSRMTQIMAPIWQVDAQSMDVLNKDELVRLLAEIGNFPKRALNSEKDVAKIREDRAKQMQQQREMEMAREGAAAAKDMVQASGMQEAA